jgi:hypothetical protein
MNKKQTPTICKCCRVKATYESTYCKQCSNIILLERKIVLDYKDKQLKTKVENLKKRLWNITTDTADIDYYEAEKIIDEQFKEFLDDMEGQNEKRNNI